MWEVIDFIVKFLIQEGGIWGLLVALAVGWIGFREWNLAKKKREQTEKSNAKVETNNIVVEEATLIKERQENQIKILDQNSERLDQVNEKLQDISIHIDNFVKINESNNEKIEKLTEQLQQVNDERVEELKDILSSYNKTMNELALTLQKIKFVLKSRLGED